MLQFFSRQTFLFYAMAVICAWGVISQAVLRLMYGSLLRDVKRQGMPKGKFMKQLRQRYQSICRMKQNAVNPLNTGAFIRKNLLEYRFLGNSLHGWKRMAGMAAVLCGVCGIAGWYISQPQAAGGMRQTYLMGTLLAEGISLVVYGLLDTGFARQSLEILLQDDLDNALTLRMSGNVQTSAVSSTVSSTVSSAPAKTQTVFEHKEEAVPESEVAAATEQSSFSKTVSMPGRKKKIGKNSRETQSQKDKQELKTNLGKIREGIRETAAAADTPKEQSTRILRQMDSDEQERVIREVLKELLS